MRRRWDWLADRRIALLAALAAVVLASPGLRLGLLQDDYFHRFKLHDVQWQSSVFPRDNDLFAFSTGQPELIHHAIDLGVTPWWTYEGLHISFFRPLAALTHKLDYLLWPENPTLMHAHSLLWFAAMVGAAALLYQRFMGLAAVAGLATLLFAVDDSHAVPASYLANRAVLPAAVFGFAALVAHDRWREHRETMGWVWGPMLLGVSLLFAEAAIGAFAYLLAYALCLDRGPWLKRGLSLVPYLGVVALWRLVWQSLGYGASGTGGYVDPVLEPIRFLGWVAGNAPLYGLAQWAFPPSDVAIVMGPEQVSRLRISAILFLAVTALALWPLLRSDRLARFWALGMVLAVIPICATLPQDRHLIYVGLGASGLLAMFVTGVLGGADWLPKSHLGRWASIVLVLFFLAVHAAAAPFLMYARAGNPLGPRTLMSKMILDIDTDPAAEQQSVICVNAPIAMYVGFFPALKALAGEPVPKHTRILAPSLANLDLSRPDAKTLVVRSDRGYTDWALDALFRGPAHPLALGYRIALSDLTVEITGVNEAGPEVTFHFEVPLEDPSLAWLQWRKSAFVPFVPPPIGGSVHVATEIDFGSP